MARPTGTGGKAATLDNTQLKRLRTISMARKYGERDSTIVEVSYFLGLRAKELAALSIRDIYCGDGSLREVLQLGSKHTKGGKSRELYLTNEVLRRRLIRYGQWIGDQGCQTDALFRSRTGRRFSANGMVQLLREIHFDAGLDGCSSHSGRRTMITELSESGVDLKTIAVIAGHSSISTTAGYVADNPRRLARILSDLRK